MAKFDLSKYKIQNPQENEIPIVKKFDLSKYEISTPNEYEREAVDNDEYPYLVNKTADVISRYPIDLAHDLAYAGERGAKWIAGKLADYEEQNPIDVFDHSIIGNDEEDKNDWSRKFREFSQKPDYFSEENIGRPSNRITRPIFKEAGFNLDAEAPDQIQGMIGHGIDFAVPGAWAKKAKLANMAIEGATGLGSGLLQEYGGVNPIVADLTTYAGRRGVSRTNSALRDHFNPIKRGEKKVSALFKDTTKEKGLDNLMNFNPEGLDVIPVTAEVALHNDISNLHNAYAPNFTGIQSKMTANDEILRRKLNNIGSESNPTQIEVGEAGREVISKKLGKLEKAREKAASPLYAKLEESPNLYPTENLNNYTEQAVAKELGDIEKGLNKNKSLLPDKYKRLAEKSKTELTELEKEVNKIITQVEKEYPGLSFQAKDQILNELMPGFRGKISKIGDLKEKIATLESGHYSPGHIDKAITEIGNNITELKRSAKGGNDSLIRHFTKQKKALEVDLEATPEGLAHRQVYKEHSPEINKINRDKLLKKFVSKDEWDAYRVPVDDLPRNIMASPKASVVNYMQQVKGTPAEKLTKAYFRDMYLGKATDHNLPTYDKSSQFLRERGHKLDAIYSPEELGVFKQINEYLKNRAEVARGNSAFGSATEPKGRITQRVKKYLGEENLTPYTAWGDLPGIRKLPFIPQRLKGITVPNRNYEIFEKALTDPIYARDLLTKDYGVKYTKPNYLPTLYNVLNGNQE